jgi:hypothetical protein
MTVDRQQGIGDGARFRTRLLLGLLIAFHIVICCVSLIYLAENNNPVAFRSPLFYDAARLYVVIPIIAAFALVSALFLVSGFSFGYFLGFYCYTMVLGYLWLNCFTDLNYDHRLAGFAAAAAAIAFLLPSFLLLAIVAFLKLFEARVAVVLSLTAPIVAGIVLHILAGPQTASYFSAINFRVVAIPSIAMDVYNDFFAKHELTHFCQINLLSMAI